MPLRDETPRIWSGSIEIRHGALQRGDLGDIVGEDVGMHRVALHEVLMATLGEKEFARFKTGDDRFYEVFVPIADTLYDEHLAELRREGLL